MAPANVRPSTDATPGATAVAPSPSGCWPWWWSSSWSSPASGGTSRSASTTTSAPPAARSTSSTLRPAKGAVAAVTTGSGPASIEAGVAPWQLPAAVSREAVVPNGSGFTVLGGLAASQASVASVYSVNPATGAATPSGTLPAAVHDAAGLPRRDDLRARRWVAGHRGHRPVGGHPGVSRPRPGPGVTTGTVAGELPTPRSDLAVATVGPPDTADGLRGRRLRRNHVPPSVLATTDGTHYTTVAQLTVPVRYAAVVAHDGLLYAFGGQTASPGRPSRPPTPSR